MNAHLPRRLVVGSLAALAAVALVATGSAEGTGALPLLERGALGDVAKPGGARRLDGDQSGLIAASIAEESAARNVIIIIGDGMGDSEITIARNYLKGAGGFLEGLDALPLTGQMTTYSVKADGTPDYTPDSAATGTAWATGSKTYDGAIAVDRTGKPLTSLLKLAKESGRATGNVTTSEIQDATPAVQVASVTGRKCYGPSATSATCPDNALENGGAGSISEQLLDTRADLILAGGSATFAEQARAGQWAGMTLEQQARERGFQYLTGKADLATLTEADQDSPVLGLFSSGNMPVRFNPYVAQPGKADTRECTVNPDFDQVPSLKEMTDKGIELLASSEAGRTNGFFLQVESASIDKKDHAADVCGQIGETEQMDEAVKSALDFAKADGDTLVIVTADHAHTSQILDGEGPGLNSRVITEDGAHMVVGYNTSAAGGSQQHTGTQIRVAAYGPGAANVVGLIDQTDLFFVARDAMQTWDASHPGASPSPSVSPTTSPTPSASPTATPGTGAVNVYTTPGLHDVNGRRWQTTCEPYSQTTRCRTEIWSTTVVREGSGFRRSTGWHFNNLTYRPEMTKAAWGANPLANTGEFTSGGRQWRTECGTAATGRDACRSYLRAEVISATRSGGGYTYSVKQDWVFNNQVLFRKA